MRDRDLEFFFEDGTKLNIPSEITPPLRKNRQLTCKYDVTTPEPGLKLLLTNFGIERPASTAFLAKSPAVNMTLGLLVLEQEAMGKNGA